MSESSQDERYNGLAIKLRIVRNRLAIAVVLVIVFFASWSIKCFDVPLVCLDCSWDQIGPCPYNKGNTRKWKITRKTKPGPFREFSKIVRRTDIFKESAIWHCIARSGLFDLLVPRMATLSALSQLKFSLLFLLDSLQNSIGCKINAKSRHDDTNSEPKLEVAFGWKGSLASSHERKFCQIPCLQISIYRTVGPGRHDYTEGHSCRSGFHHNQGIPKRSIKVVKSEPTK